MAQLNAYLHFEGTCREAMNFYKDCLGGKVDFAPMGDMPGGGDVDPKKKDEIMHSVLKNEHITLMASDNMMGGKIVGGNNMTLCLVCSSKDELNRLFTALSAGGTIRQAVQDVFFGTFGAFTDKFGIDWMMQFGAEMDKK